MRHWKWATAALMCIAFTIFIGSSAIAVEMKLAGIKLGVPATDVLKRYGNPTRITIGSQVVGTVTTTTGPMLGPGVQPGVPTTGGGYGYGTEPGALPGFPGMGMPGTSYQGMPGMPGSTGMPGTTGAAVGPAQVQSVVTETQVTWTYDWPDGITTEFLISSTGKVVQITIGGLQPSKSSVTSKGIKLGSTYKDVIFKYGWPEGQSTAGRYFRLSYADKHRVVFTLLDKKVVGITIALQSQ